MENQGKAISIHVLATSGGKGVWGSGSQMGFRGDGWGGGRLCAMRLGAILGLVCGLVRL